MLEDTIATALRSLTRSVKESLHGIVRVYALSSIGIIGSCADQRVFQEPAPCAGVDCGEYGSCAVNENDDPLCVCQPGYELLGTKCVPNEDSYRDEPDAGMDMAGDSTAKTDKCLDACLDEHTLQSCPPTGKEFFVQECPEGMYCEESACRTIPGGNDLSCSTGTSACRVTDTYNVIEDWRSESADFSSSVRFYSDTVDSCGEDDGFRVGLSDGYWMAHTLRILPPPEGNGYYRLDFKMNWEGECQSGPPCCREYEHDFTPSMKVLFGDDQRVDYSPTEKTRECIFEKIADFTTAGISESSVRINVEGNPTKECAAEGQYASNYSGIVIAKTRIWSCACE